MSVSKESFWLPKALRRTVVSSTASVCCPGMPAAIREDSMIIPAQVP